MPFAALPTATGFAVEDRLITYLDRSVDVLRPASDPGVGALLVGAVDYEASAVAAPTSTRSFLAPCNGGDFAPLPGTVSETDAVAERWQRVRKQPLERLSGNGATESAVAAAMAGKALVHVATHGFFAAGSCKSAVDDGVGYDPMVLSGLVLAGANRPADPEAPEDGILTASEVASRDLTDTGVVVLSACETGLGEVASGQGVLGLRRAFAVAGARTLVMSLWSVGDAETAALMDGLYQRHLERRSVPVALALREAQLDVLAHQRAVGAVHPFAWAAFVAAGDWR